MRIEVSRLVAAYDGSGRVLAIKLDSKSTPDFVSVWRKRGGRFETSWWSSKTQDLGMLREFSDALRSAETFIANFSACKVFVVRWTDEDGERDSQGVLHTSLEEAKYWLAERAAETRVHAPEFPGKLPFELAIENGEWTEFEEKD